MPHLTLHHVAANIDEIGGPRYTVPELCESLGALGHQVHLHVLEPCPPFEPQKSKLHIYPRSDRLAKIGSSPRMKAALQAAAPQADVLHGHGLWLMPNIYAARAVRNTRCQLVMSPRGTLAPWAMQWHRWRKLPFWLLGQRPSLARASCLHATALHEYEDIRNLGFKAPVMVVPNGVTIPDLPVREEAPGRRQRILYFGRVHPTKGVDRLLRAWCRVQDSFPQWELRIAGPDRAGHLDELKRLASALGAKRTEFTGEIEESRKSSEYRSADLYVLPTHHDNWAVTVTEALAHEVPVVVSRAAPWSEVESKGCGWWIENSVDSIADCLERALAQEPATLQAMGRRGRAWIQSAFPWSKVAQQTQDAYRWLVEGGTPPPWVLVD